MSFEAPLQTLATESAISIRRYDEADEPQLLRLVRELQEHEGAHFDRMKPAAEIGPWYVDVLKKDCARHEGAFLVAEHNGKVVGYATILTRVEEDGGYDEVPYTYAYVGDLAVLESRRGRGIGTRLLEECEAHARAAGRRWLRIDVLARNARAHAAYRRFGFVDHLVSLEKPLA